MSESKILVIEDDVDTQVGLSVRLKAAGYGVVIAVDGVSAMSVARKEEPDLILLDLGLPAGDGFVVLDRLKKNPTLAMIPIIVLTAEGSVASRIKCMREGATAFFQKPANNAELMDTIQELLNPAPVS